MRVFMTKWMTRFVRRERIGAKGLFHAISRAQSGAIDANLGGGLIKQRMARPGGGRSAGYRTIIAYRSGARAVFFIGFAKSERDNIGGNELNSLRQLGANWLNADAATITQALGEGALTEIEDVDEQIQPAVAGDHGNGVKISDALGSSTMRPFESSRSVISVAKRCRATNRFRARRFERSGNERT